MPSFGYHATSVSTTCSTFAILLSFPVCTSGTWKIDFSSRNFGSGLIKMHTKSGDRVFWEVNKPQKEGFNFSAILKLKAPENIYISLCALDGKIFEISEPYLHGMWIEHKCDCNMQLIIAQGCQCGGS